VTGSSHRHRGAPNESGEHGPGHGISADADSRNLAIALGLICAFLVFEVVMAFAGHSLAFRLARRPAAGIWTFGFRRAEVLSARANGMTLLVVSALVAFEAISRLIHPVTVHGAIVVVVAAVGVAVNVAATWVIARANRASINVKGAFAHIITDLYGFIGTLAA
jgi:cobalt-zinc-cadmium efflux system protein